MTSKTDTIVSALGLTKVFRDFWGRPKAKAVNDIDFEIKEGEVVGLLGPNGSGKSTTVKLLLGLLYPTGGSLSVLGRSPRAVETKKEIGYLPEESYLYKYLTAEETLDFFGSLFNLSKAERKRRIDQLLEMVGMVHARRRRVGEFSKGMARRIGLAQAMINDPAFLILDEPTSGLDPSGCKEVKDLIIELKKRGKTVLITSHLLSDIEDVCDRVIILYGGQVRATGTLNELLTVPDESRIVTPSLDPKTMQRVIEILRENLDEDQFHIDKPRRTLEEFFLDVVSSAKAESVETAGVVSGGGIADYLKQDDTDAVLASILTEKAPVEKPKEKEKEKEPEVTDDKLKDLMSESTDKKAAPTINEQEQQQRENANVKLQDLLGKKDEE